jgi:anti-sigma regulatory factor (Ser/Thr protein kinase)
LTEAASGLREITVSADAASLVHHALVYGSDEQFIEHVAPFLREGLEQGPTMTVLTRRHWSLLREELGSDAGEIAFTDCDDFYIRPVDVIAAYDATTPELVASGARSVRVAAEIPIQATRGEWSDWISYEAIVNRALENRPIDVLCVYGMQDAPDDVIDAVWRTHQLVEGNGSAGHPHYHDPREVVATQTATPGPLPDLHTLAATDDPLEFRELLAAELAAARAPNAKALDLLVAASEVFENARRHGGGVSRVRAGLVDGWFACEIEDQGPGLDDPLAGYLPPRPEQAQGEGLWIARRLVRRLELLDNAPGLTVRLWL